MPGRFHYLFEFDPRQGVVAGTPAQQSAIRGFLDREAPFGSDEQLVLRQLASHVKRDVASHVTVVFDEFFAEYELGVAYAHTIVLSTRLLPEHAARVFIHEVGHLWDRHVMTPTDRAGWLRARTGFSQDPLGFWSKRWTPYREDFANHFRRWFRGIDTPPLPEMAE